MKKKKITFAVCLVFAGIIAYLGGYYGYQLKNPKTELRESLELHHSISSEQNPAQQTLNEYYMAKIEQELLMVYKMPEEILYESVELSSLHMTEKEKKGLINGMIFWNLSEVFEFLENSMS